MSEQQNPQRYYSIDEVVSLLKQAGLDFTPRTIRNWIKIGKVKAIRPGRRQWFISSDELQKLLKEENRGNSLLTLRARLAVA
jgi:hypothetical protein